MIGRFVLFFFKGRVDYFDFVIIGGMIGRFVLFFLKGGELNFRAPVGALVFTL